MADKPIVGIKSWFGKINTKEDAVKIIREIMLTLFILAFILVALGFFVTKLAIIDGIAYAILGTLLYKLRSRAVAILLFMMTLLTLVLTAINLVTKSGGMNVILAVIIFGIGIRAIQATFAYRKLTGYKFRLKKFRQRMIWTGFILPAVSFVGFLILMISSAFILGTDKAFENSDIAMGILGVFMLLFGIGTLMLMVGIGAFLYQKTRPKAIKEK